MSSTAVKSTWLNDTSRVGHLLAINGSLQLRRDEERTVPRTTEGSNLAPRISQVDIETLPFYHDLVGSCISKVNNRSCALHSSSIDNKVMHV